MQCFQDCCLFCDRDSPDGPYCSQRCKLADHERSSQPTTPQSSTTASSSTWARSRTSTYFDASTPSHTIYGPQNDRSLSPSSSRTSLSSTMSSSFGGISAQAKQDLQGFFSSFDQAKAAKRRSSVR